MSTRSYTGFLRHLFCFIILFISVTPVFGQSENGKPAISGDFSKREAQELANMLKSDKSNTPARYAPSRVYCGTYTSGSSAGIYLIGSGKELRLTDSMPASNPSFLALSAGGRRLYAVHENSDSLNDGGSVSAYQVDRRGRLRLLNRMATRGNSPCYLSLHPDGHSLYVANYGGGSLTVFGLDKDGALTGPLQTIGFTGKGLLPDRQSSPHAHAAVVSPDGNHLLVTDLGTDRILIYEIDRKTGSLSAAAEPYLPVHAGAGPRHLAFHPNGKYLYLSEELSGTIGVFAYGAGKLKLMQTISTVAEDYKGQFSVSHLQCAPDGRFLYAGNRATANTIVVYAIDPSGILSVVQHQPVSGIKPRHFNISPDGAELWVANQSSHEVVVFNRNAQSGLLSESGRRIKIPSPTCLLWLK